MGLEYFCEGEPVIRLLVSRITAERELAPRVEPRGEERHTRSSHHHPTRYFCLPGSALSHKRRGGIDGGVHGRLYLYGCMQFRGGTRPQACACCVAFVDGRDGRCRVGASGRSRLLVDGRVRFNEHDNSVAARPPIAESILRRTFHQETTTNGKKMTILVHSMQRPCLYGSRVDFFKSITMM